MDHDTIISILKEWNPWEKTIFTGIPRSAYLARIYPYLERKEILVLTGIRRAGKSTIMKQLMQELIRNQVDKKQILYLNLEDYKFMPNLTVSLFDDVLQAYKKYFKNTNRTNRIYLFIDEAQKITGWESWVRTYYDRDENIKFIVSGSSASLLSREFSTLLTGRNISFTVKPLTFTEFCAFQPAQPFDEHTVESYIQWGGFPEVVLEPQQEKKKTLLQQYFSDILNKDIIERHQIRNTKQLIELARYLVSSAGGKVSVNKLSRILGISKDTVSLYINYLIDAYLLYEVPWFSYSLKIRHDVTKLPKLYAADNGLIQVAGLQQNLGLLVENAVLVHLLENYKEVMYWSGTQSEVDFIVDTLAINVTFTDKIPAREKQGLEDFKKQHQHYSTLLITKTTTKPGWASLQGFLEGKSTKP